MENVDLPNISEPSTGLPVFTLGLIIAAIIVASVLVYRWFRKPSAGSDQGHSDDQDDACEGDQCQME